MSVPIVVDEWLFHDLAGDNGSIKQEETFRFLYKILKICDRIVILEDSPFASKIGQFIKSSENDTTLKEISKFLNGSILTNSLKTELLPKENIKPLPSHLAKLVPSDDRYLFQAHLALKGSFILTTDGRWPVKLTKQKSIKIEMRDSFLKKYLDRIV